MPLTLEQYAQSLDTRDLPWPAPPEIDRPKAKPSVVRLPDVRAVTWGGYGTLVAIAGGDLLFEHPKDFIMDLALDKTIQEFKMWGSMSRKPGQPADYFKQLYLNVLSDQKMASGGERYPEVVAERVWEALVKKLLQKEYKFDAGYYGPLGEFCRKIAYFFHASLQGTCCFPGAAAALRAVRRAGRVQGLIANGQCFTAVQLKRGLAKQDASADLDELLEPELRVVSADLRARKPTERLFEQVLEVLRGRDIEPSQVLHVGPSVPLDVVPAKRLGMRTALFAGDRAAIQATPEQLKDPASRPDMLITELTQVADVFADPSR